MSVCVCVSECVCECVSVCVRECVYLCVCVCLQEMNCLPEDGVFWWGIVKMVLTRHEQLQLH